MKVITKKKLLSAASRKRIGRLFLHIAMFTVITVLLFLSVYILPLLVTAIGLLVVEIFILKKFSKANVNYKSIKKDNYYIKLVPVIGKKHYSTSTYGTLYFFGGYNDVVDLDEYHDTPLGTLYYFVYSNETREVCSIFNSRRFELSGEIAHKLIK